MKTDRDIVLEHMANGSTLPAGVYLIDKVIHLDSVGRPVDVVEGAASGALQDKAD